MSSHTGRDESIQPLTKKEKTCLQKLSSSIRNLGEMIDRYKKHLSPNNAVSRARLEGNAEMAAFMADLIMAELSEPNKKLLATTSPRLSALVMPHIKSFVESANALAEVATAQGVDSPTLDQILGRNTSE